MDIQDYVPIDLQKNETIRLEEAKMSILNWLHVYFTFSLQQAFLQVVSFNQKIEAKDSEFFRLIVQQRHLIMRPYDQINCFISFNKKIISSLVLEQPHFSPPKQFDLFGPPQQGLIFNNGYDNDELLIFQYQSNYQNFEEYYINKRKPQKLDVV